MNLICQEGQECSSRRSDQIWMIENMHRGTRLKVRSINPWAGDNLDIWKLLDPKPTDASFKDILTHSVKTGTASYINRIEINVQASWLNWVSSMDCHGQWLDDDSHNHMPTPAYWSRSQWTPNVKKESPAETELVISSWKGGWRPLETDNGALLCLFW